MVAAHLIEKLEGSSAGAGIPLSSRSQTRPGLPWLLAVALLVLVLYTAFDHGAVSLASGAWTEVVLAGLAAVAAAGWLGSASLRFSVSRPALVGLGLLAAFAAWSGITLVWSVAPDQTWIELNRVLGYVIVAALGITIGASYARASDVLGQGFLAVALAVTVYALGQKLVPGLHVSGLFDLNQTEAIPRLQEPIGYWNALALFLVLAVPIALHLAVDAIRSRGTRLAAACALELMLLTIGLTLSRGGLLALAVALAVVLTGALERLRTLTWLALTVLATAPPLAVALTLHSLTTAGVSLSSREAGGGILAGVLLASLAGLWVAGRALVAFEPHLRLGPTATQRARRLGLAAAAVLVLGALLGLVLGGALSSFTSPYAPSNVSPNRLLTADSYRWLWWKEAARAFAARPLGGWGAGSFGVVHLRYRQNTLPVQQPHSLPLQFLSETGIVGAILGLGALTLFLLAAIRGARRPGPAGERAARIALLAAAAAYVVHTLYDWDWSIPAVTIPALLFLGVLAGSYGGRGAARALAVPGFRPHGLALALVTLWLCFFAFSAVLPSLAASQANAALVQAAGSSPSALDDAQASARLASSLDPLADAGLRVEALIAFRRGQLSRARRDLEDALARDPSDELAWNDLVQVDLSLRETAAAQSAARWVIALDPRGPTAQGLIHSALLSGAS